jgi:Family of unknown function (DUF6644)
MSFTAWVESTALSTWLRQSTSLWAFPFVLSIHTFGMAILAGLNSALALRVLGVARRVPIESLQRLFPIMWGGFSLSAASGVLLFIAAATLKAPQLLFWIKLALVTCGMVNLHFLRRALFPDDAASIAAPRTVKALAIASLVVWTATITAGRFMAYL